MKLNQIKQNNRIMKRNKFDTNFILISDLKLIR